MANSSVLSSGRRMKTTPIATPKSLRNHDFRVLTSLPAGRVVPVAVIPMLREDSLQACRMRLSFESMETAEILMNAINVKVRAHLVPNLAYERFSGMDELNRAYEGIPNEPGGQVTPYFATHVHAAGNEIFRYLGKHAKVGDKVNSAYVEAYNVLWNYMAENRSPDLEHRLLDDKTLAPAFWEHGQFDHIVPDFDQAVIDGAVPIMSDGRGAPVTGIYKQTGRVSGTVTSNDPWKDSAGNAKVIGDRFSIIDARQTDGASDRVDFRTKKVGTEYWPDIRAELNDAGLTISLATIDLAKKTQAFAKLRSQYSSLSDDYLIDLLMDGISIPEQAWRQPMLIAERGTIFGMAKRYASDGANLTESVVSGATFIDMVLRTPVVPCGGLIMVTVEITPEQLFERQQDPYMYSTQTGTLPAYLRDTLDPEKVAVVTCGQIDVSHSTPATTFGYAPLNHEWNNAHPCVGGKFHRPTVNTTFDEDRQRIWAVEQVDPKLGEDFYISKNIHTKPFVVTNQDPFEVIVRGNGIIAGNTVFGGALVEAHNDYAEVLAEAPLDKIVKA